MVSPICGKLVGAMASSTMDESLILDGIIAGVGAVLGFFTTTGCPVFMFRFFKRLWLYGTDCLCHGSFVSEIGLSGKSFIPILVATGCGVPGVMASRMIETNAIGE